MDLPIPNSIAEITPDWLTEALRCGGAIIGTCVTSFECEPIAAGIGFLGELARLRLIYDAVEPSAPATLIAKAPIQDPGGRQLGQMLGVYEIEDRYYREMAAHSPMRGPHCYYTAGNAEAAQFILLIEDLGQLRLGDQLAGLTLDEARIAMREFARFHACFWDTPVGPQFSGIPGFDHPRLTGLEMAYPAAKDQCLARIGGLLARRDRELVEGFGTRFASVGRPLETGRVTIAHGDARLDNFFFGSTDGSATLTVVDYQLLIHAPGAYDIGYMLSQSLDPELRRRHEHDLLREYHDTLVASGVDCYPWERCWEDYRRAVLFWLVGPIVGIGTVDPANERGARVLQAMTQRSLAAIDDLNCRDLLPT
jgi:hypothetical protein